MIKRAERNILISYPREHRGVNRAPVDSELKKFTRTEGWKMFKGISMSLASVRFWMTLLSSPLPLIHSFMNFLLWKEDWFVGLVSEAEGASTLAQPWHHRLPRCLLGGHPSLLTSL